MRYAIAVRFWGSIFGAYVVSKRRYHQQVFGCFVVFNAVEQFLYAAGHVAQENLVLRSQDFKGVIKTVHELTDLSVLAPKLLNDVGQRRSAFEYAAHVSFVLFETHVANHVCPKMLETGAQVFNPFPNLRTGYDAHPAAQVVRQLSDFLMFLAIPRRPFVYVHD